MLQVGFNWIDVVIVLLLVGAIFIGLRVGFFRLLLTVTGFFVGLFVGGWLLPHILPFKNRTTLAIVNGNLVLILAVYCGLKGYDYGKKLHLSLGHGTMRIVESLAGVGVSVSSMIFSVWMLAAALGSLPFVGLSNAVNDAAIPQFLNRQLPPVPAVFEEFSSLVDPNTVPEVYIKAFPYSSVGATPVVASVPKPVVQDGNSVVRITSFGCGGIVGGSGFVVAPGLIITAAHVIAGLSRPTVKYHNHSYAATPVLFNPNLDIAALRVAGLKAPSLSLNTSDQLNGTTIDSIGYPNSIYTIAPGTIVASLAIEGTNIYGIGAVTRDIYVLRSPVIVGESGGPVLLSNGSVAGIVFARANDIKGYGYALTSSSIASSVEQAMQTTKPIGTGTCFAGE